MLDNTKGRQKITQYKSWNIFVYMRGFWKFSWIL